jgi:Protein of unknown function (DUF3168)
MTAYGLVNQALYSRLAGDAQLTAMLAGGTATASVYLDVAPDNAVLPYVVFSHHTGVELSLSAHRDPDELLYVRGYAAAPSMAGSIDARIEALLHFRPLTISGWTNIWLARETDISNVETDEALVKTFNAGALYRSKLST